MPGCAPGPRAPAHRCRGGSSHRHGWQQEPCLRLMPNFILRGARLATSTVSLPTSCRRVGSMLAMPENTLRVSALGILFTGIQCQAQQFGGAFHGFAVARILRDAQIHLGEVVDGDGGGQGLATGGFGSAGAGAALAAFLGAACAATGACSSLIPKRASKLLRGSTRCIRCWYSPIPWRLPTSGLRIGQGDALDLHEGFPPVPPDAGSTGLEQVAREQGGKP
jgi:hypothetical protein